LETRQLCRETKREKGARNRFTEVNKGGTAAAKECGMLTLSAFVIALGSVFTSVVWACKEDMVDRA
jgi:hypothetical protein